MKRINLTILILFLFFNIVFSQAGRDFIIRNTSNLSITFFVVNGTTGRVGIGMTNPQYRLDISGDLRVSGGIFIGATQIITPSGNIINVLWVNATNINATQSIRASQICIGNDCRSSWPSIAESDPFWNANITQVSLNYLIRRTATGIGQSLIYDTGTAIGIGTTSPSQRLEINGSLRLTPSSQPPAQNGTIYYDATLNKFRCFQNNVWVDCIPTITEAGTGFWNLTGSFLYPRDLGWNVGIGTSTPTERLEVHGRLKVVSSSPFELQPSDQILDVLGSINATNNLFVANNISSTNLLLSDSLYFSEVRLFKGAANRLDLASGNSLNLASGNLMIGGNVVIDASRNVNATSLLIGGTTVITSGRVLQNIASVNTHLIPSSDNAFDLGSVSNRWRWINATNINASSNIYSSGYFIGTTQVIDSTRNILNINNISMSGNLIVGGSTVITSDRIIRAANGSASSPSFSFIDEINTGIYRAANGVLGIAIGGTGRLFISSISVNSTLPLFVTSGSASSPSFSFISDTTTGIYLPVSNSLGFVTNGTERLRIDSEGRVGINTNVPTERLEVHGRLKVVSSSPFELEPSDQILDVKGSINATIVIYIPRHSTQPFACTSMHAGALFYNTSNNRFYGCNGTSWVMLG